MVYLKNKCRTCHEKIQVTVKPDKSTLKCDCGTMDITDKDIKIKDLNELVGMGADNGLL